VEEDRIASASDDRSVKIWVPRYRLEESKFEPSLTASETKSASDDTEVEDSRIKATSGSSNSFATSSPSAEQRRGMT